MIDLHLKGDESITEELKWLSHGPDVDVLLYDGYIINGYRFHTRDLEARRKTQNNGVTLRAETSSYASRKDRNPIDDMVTYYGVLDQVIELQFGPTLTIVLFKCTWFDEQTTNGFKIDTYGFKCLNVTRVCHQDEPFMLASYAEQCFYISSPDEPDWHVVLSRPPRDLFDIP